MSKYRYEGYGVVRDLELDMPYHTDDIVDLLEEKDQQIVELQEKVKKLEYDNGELASLIDTMRYEDPKINELQKQLEEKEKDNQFFKKMYLSEKQKNDNYLTEKYALNKSVEELRKIKLTPKEKEIYYKGFDNCERQFATHIAELQQQLKNQPAEIVEKIKKEFEANGDNYCEIRKCTSPYTNHQYSWFNYVRFRDYLNTLLKEYQK